LRFFEIMVFQQKGKFHQYFNEEVLSGAKNPSLMKV